MLLNQSFLQDILFTKLESTLKNHKHPKKPNSTKNQSTNSLFSLKESCLIDKPVKREKKIFRIHHNTGELRDGEQDNSNESEKMLNCTYEDCPKSYRTKENLMLHIKNVHLQIKPYECSYCSSKFSHRNGKIYHERKIHLNYFPYHCKFESKCFLI